MSRALLLRVPWVGDPGKSLKKVSVSGPPGDVLAAKARSFWSPPRANPCESCEGPGPRPACGPRASHLSHPTRRATARSFQQEAVFPVLSVERWEPLEPAGSRYICRPLTAGTWGWRTLWPRAADRAASGVASASQRLPSALSPRRGPQISSVSSGTQGGFGPGVRLRVARIAARLPGAPSPSQLGRRRGWGGGGREQECSHRCGSRLGPRVPPGWGQRGGSPRGLVSSLRSSRLGIFFLPFGRGSFQAPPSNQNDSNSGVP